LVFVLALGLVSWAWSEVGFWAHVRADDNAGTWVLTWLLYSLVAGVVARVLVRRPARGAASLLLTGALYGWLVEGVIAATVYLALPFSLVWTGVAWHGLLTVVVGWWALPRALRRGGVTAVATSALVGVAWGLWSVAWWGAPPDDGQVAATPAVAAYAVFVAIVAGASGLGYGLMGARGLQTGDLTSRWMTRLVVLALAVWGVLVVVLALPWAPLLLGVLLWLVTASRRRLDDAARRSTSDPVGAPHHAGGWASSPDVTAPLGFEPGVPWRRLGAFTALPVAAVATYAGLTPAAPTSTGSGAFYVGFIAAVAVLSVLGAASLAWALWCAWRPRSDSAAVVAP
jgi:hypothetical protein